MTEPKVGYKAGEAKAVEVRFEVRQVKSMVDHSYNVTVNLPEDCLPQVQWLMGKIGDELRAVIEPFRR